MREAYGVIKKIDRILAAILPYFLGITFGFFVFLVVLGVQLGWPFPTVLSFAMSGLVMLIMRYWVHMMRHRDEQRAHPVVAMDVKFACSCGDEIKVTHPSEVMPLLLMHVEKEHLPRN